MKETRLLLLAALVLLLSACSQRMRDQPKLNWNEPSDFFANGTSSQAPVPDTVPRGYAGDDPPLFTGKDASGKDLTAFPFLVTRQDLQRGEQRFDIYCAPCHGRLGTGGGVIVARGFTTPPTFHSDRLRQAPVGHFFDVITNGFGAMPSYSTQIPVRDRWDIVAYVRALQLSQHATLDDVPPDQRQKLQGGG